MSPIEPLADRTLGEIHKALWNVHRDVGALATKAVHLQPGVKLVLFREPLRCLERDLNQHFRDFMSLDANLIARAIPPSGYNAATQSAAKFQMYFGVRDSVRGLLVDTNAVLGSLRNELAFRTSLAVAVGAIVLSAASLLVSVLSE